MNKKGGKKDKELRCGKSITKNTNMVFVNNGNQCRARFTLEIDFYTRVIMSLRLDGVDTCGGSLEGSACRGLHQSADLTPCRNRHETKSIIRTFFTDLDNRIARE